MVSSGLLSKVEGYHRSESEDSERTRKAEIVEKD